MDKNFINIYNYLINYTRNEQLYSSLNRNDNFSDRLTLFLLHFAFFLKNFKNDKNKEILQKIYDFNFRQLELSIREIGYGDQSINKKMKVYINLFHSMVSEIHFWDDFNRKKKIEKLSIFLEDSPLKSFTLGRAIFTRRSINSYIFEDLKVTLTPAFAPFLVLKFEIDFLNFVTTGF